ncbi:MBL fold metallo-hydrolase [Paenibacillus thiaminolyticus]|uniref:MBL fold metallo-hydrolase n=1 Tax=Paenibacillus thiaminolyticus TaxID=49283 RepID=A0AAP9DR47_PANTH|nr:MBL fold metallo-hydrolase [Paenibacillus thiaminolyticus]MCY9538089.1 MBL fold metallo-hydrolase [Paenibacillus thiaminolyticus]MCY9605510.1 MBL fold metallo-hydrolase [Paenibacillus thiaminolyticus]MCY9610436.1 MBL fold metallo-hydrolase [Paenibacillus thiaminolyticus]MCY9612849.1 MBL fold metallo-hydrolase [Paenibacillus thiaminolyticus]MCY9621552.1 MBL fold metallo-hydrolase [Paenibacillus thiaminolyticus]
MDIRLVRNATLVLQYADKRFLIDPFFAAKGTLPPFPNTPNQDTPNPIVDLPLPIEELTQVDAVIVTHLHPDHFDEAAKAALPKDIKIYAQNERDAELIKKEGFHQVETFHQASMGDILLTRTNGSHGIGDITQFTGEVSGLVLSHPDEQKLYIAGDTVWYSGVQAAIDTHQPELIIVNGGAAQFLAGGPITMTADDIYKTHQAAPQAKIIVVHMESLNHCLLTREKLKRFINEKQISSHIMVPCDGDIISL